MKQLFNRLSAFVSALALSLSSLLFIAVPNVSAATCTWSGGGSSDNFNDAANWSNCASSVPQNGDSLTFDVTGLAATTTVTNDLVGLSIAGITFTGTNASYYGYKITGNAITITSTIDDSADTTNWLDLDITLGGNVTVTEAANSRGVIIGEYGGATPRTFDVNGNTLSITGSGASCGFHFNTALTGSGSISSNLDAPVMFPKAATSFTAAVSASAGTLYVNEPTALGSTTGVTISGSASLGFGMQNADRTLSFPITLGGTGTLQASLGGFGSGCSGGDADQLNKKLTLTGTVTLNSNFKYMAWDVDTEVTGTYTSNGYSFSVTSGSRGGITTPSGSASAPAETVVVNAGDDAPGTFITLTDNQTYVINGTRGDITVTYSSTLKGTGTVGTISVMSGGTVAPGESPGCLASGNVTFVSGSSFDVELGGTTVCTEYDQLQVTGTVDVTNATLNTTFWNGYVPAAGNTFTIIANDAADAVTGTFTGLAEGATLTVNGVDFTISYVGGDGNDVVLTVTNVPATPNAGAETLLTNPIAVMFYTLMVSGTILGISRKYNLLRG